jgi:hypothetical protein
MYVPTSLAFLISNGLPEMVPTSLLTVGWFCHVGDTPDYEHKLSICFFGLSPIIEIAGALLVLILTIFKPPGAHYSVTINNFGQLIPPERECRHLQLRPLGNRKESLFCRMAVLQGEILNLQRNSRRCHGKFRAWSEIQIYLLTNEQSIFSFLISNSPSFIQSRQSSLWSRFQFRFRHSVN